MYKTLANEASEHYSLSKEDTSNVYVLYCPGFALMYVFPLKHTVNYMKLLTSELCQIHFLGHFLHFSHHIRRYLDILDGPTSDQTLFHYNHRLFILHSLYSPVF